jgi:predicted metal-binding protein
MAKAIRKIALEIDEEQMKADLDRYRQKVLKLGATKAAIVTAIEIPVDERVALKCQIPLCFGYGTNPNCPPHTLKPRELKEILTKYDYAVFFALDVPPEVIVRDKATIKERVAAYQQVFAIVNELESIAFYDGYYLAFGLAAGSCRHTFCGQQDSCTVMEGERCRISLRSRPSMEAVGIDVYRMVASQGWDIYPIGSDVKPEDVPNGTLAGIVIIQ